MKLVDLEVNDKAKIIVVPNHPKLYHLGLLDSDITCVGKFGGAILVEMHGTKIMLGGEEAQQIMVVRS